MMEEIGFLEIYDEEDYNHFINNIFMNSNFTDEIRSHYDSSDADVLPTSSSEEIQDTTKKYQK